MSTITALNAVLSCDSSGFTTSIGRATGKLNSLKDVGRSVWEETHTPLERYQARLSQLSGLLKRGQLDQQTYARAIKLANDQLNKMSPPKSLPPAGGGFDGLQSALSAGGFNVAALANPMTAAVVGATALAGAFTAVAAGAVTAGVAGIKLAADYEDTSVAFTTMLGSAQAAEAVLHDLTQFAAETPFEFPELSDASKKLLAFGVAGDQIVPSLRAIGDVASGIGQPIGELAEIYGKVRTQGRLFGDDIRQLGGRGIPIVAELAKQFGVSESQVSKLVEQGKVGFDNLQRAFVSLTSEGGRFEGMMENKAQTLTGLYSTLKDNVNLSLRDIGETLVQELDLKDVAKDLIDFTGVFKEEVVPEIAEGVAFFKDMAATPLRPGRRARRTP